MGKQSVIRVPGHIEQLIPYKPGKSVEEILNFYGLETAVKLASNENPLGPSPLAIRAARAALEEMAIYPNGGKTIRDALAQHHGLSVEEVIAGSGSEGVMNTAMRTFLVEGDEVVTSEGTFGGFYVLAHAIGLRLVRTPMREYAYDLDAIARAVTSKTRLVYLANPNNPTGSAFFRGELEKFLDKVPPNVLVLYDEAYCDFVDGEVGAFPSLLTARIPNVITLRTFSKSHGLAGIRIGFGTASPEIISLMLKVKLPFEPSGPAQAAGIAALGDTEFLNRTLEVNREGKKQLSEAFRSLGLRYIDTYANFFCLVLESSLDAESITIGMERHGIIVRPLAGFGLPNCVRISIGTQSDNDKAIAALGEVLESIHAIN